jgi:hypothetical protein
MALGQDLSRRSLLASLPALSVLAGCADDEDAAESDDGDVADSAVDDGAETGSTTDNAGEETTRGIDDERGAASGSGDVADEALDLREANVVDVAFEEQGGTYTFDVTLRHDDDGEDGYANWWQIERLDGTRLGRRELLHAHSQRNPGRGDLCRRSGPRSDTRVRRASNVDRSRFGSESGGRAGITEPIVRYR